MIAAGLGMLGATALTVRTHWLSGVYVATFGVGTLVGVWLATIVWAKKMVPRASDATS